MARPIDKRERNEMTKENFFRYYNKLIGCDAYLIFFEYKKNIYAYKCNHIDKNWTHKAHEATKKGGWMKFKMDMKVEHKQKILPKSTMVMTLKEFEQLPYSNKGRKCEYWLHQITNQPGTYKPDNDRFDKRGDIEIDGVRYQVKFENASLTNVNSLHNAQYEARVRARG